MAVQGQSTFEVETKQEIKTVLINLKVAPRGLKHLTNFSFEIDEKFFLILKKR